MKYFNLQRDHNYLVLKYSKKVLRNMLSTYNSIKIINGINEKYR